MFVIRVMPIARGVFKDFLSFFSRTEMPPGSVITVTIRGRKTPALVIESRDAREEKLDIRSAGFALKKLSPRVMPRHVFSAGFIRAVGDIARWHGVYEGVVMSALTSRPLLNAAPRLAEAPEEKPEVPTDATDDLRVKADVLVLQSERGERVRMYRNLAREAFARGKSVLIIAPTVIEVEKLQEELSRGIEEHVVLLSGEMTAKKLLSEWNRAVTFPKPVLVVGTPFVMSLPRNDIETIILERESGRAYRAMQRPSIDFRRAGSLVARHLGARLIYADFPLRVETRYLVDINRAEELTRSQVRPSGTAEVVVVDSRKNEDTKRTKRVFSTVSPETKERIKTEVKKGGRVAVFAARRGLAPLTVCNDCGTPVADPITGVPMVLHKTAEGNVFLSHKSGAMVPSHTACKTCGGWNLVTLGIGVDRVADELKKTFPDTDLSVFTADTAKTHRAAQRLSDAFFNTTGGIIVGTERMLPYLTEPIELIVVASMDSMLSLPVWRAHEHALSVLFYLRERSQDAFIIETRHPDHSVMKSFLSGNPADFYRADVSERERYGYPPFSTFVGLSWKGTQDAVAKTEGAVKEVTRGLDLVGPLPPEALAKNEWFSRAVIRLPQGAWPDSAILERLKKLPPAVEIQIDPDEIV